jgi:hypothetical protein
VSKLGLFTRNYRSSHHTRACRYNRRLRLANTMLNAQSRLQGKGLAQWDNRTWKANADYNVDPFAMSFGDGDESPPPKQQAKPLSRNVQAKKANDTVPVIQRGDPRSRTHEIMPKAVPLSRTGQENQRGTMRGAAQPEKVQVSAWQCCQLQRSRFPCTRQLQDFLLPAINLPCLFLCESDFFESRVHVP